MEIYIHELVSEFPYELGGELKYIETIGHGAFGTVIHVIENSTKKDMAIKVINKQGILLSSIKKMKEEIQILRKFNHKNIVKFFGYIETNNQFLIKMEYIKYGTLSHWIKNQKKITEEEASIILKNVLSAIIYLHSKQICHRDIKPENIMLSKENDLHSIKIIDFGLSAQNFDNLLNNDYCGTYLYMAPEQIEKKLYFKSVDIWSIGILMYMLLNKGNHPFYNKGDKMEDFVKKLNEKKIKFNNNISPMAKHLILKLLETNPSWRYTGLQAIKHPWITRNKEDEIPLTFNELLIKSNYKKILKDLFNMCLFMNYFSKNKKKYIIEEEYMDNCKFFNEKSRKKFLRKKEKCLDIISSNEKDEEFSEDKIYTKRKCFLNQKNKEKIYNFKYNRNQSSLIISSNNILSKKIKSKRQKNIINTKNISCENQKFNNNKNNILNLKNLNFQENVSTINLKISSYLQNQKIRKINKDKYFDINITKKINQNNNLVKSFSESLIINKNEYINKKNNNNNESINFKTLKNKKNDKKFRINNYYHFFNKKLNNILPYIASPSGKNYINKKRISLNIFDNLNNIPLNLPNLLKIKKEKKLRFENLKINSVKK